MEERDEVGELLLIELLVVVPRHDAGAEALGDLGVGVDDGGVDVLRVLVCERLVEVRADLRARTGRFVCVAAPAAG